MSFEDLLKPVPRCRACSFIESLDPTLQREIDIAMTKSKYSHEALAKGLKQVPSDDTSPSASSIEGHREREHRQPHLMGGRSA